MIDDLDEDLHYFSTKLWEALRIPEDMLYKNRFRGRGRISNFIEHSADDLVVFGFNTEKELVEHECMSRWANDPEFSHFAYSEELFNPRPPNDISYKYWIMAVMKDGIMTYVIGRVERLEGLSFPKWENKGIV